MQVPRPRNHMGGGGATNALTNGGADQLRQLLLYC